MKKKVYLDHNATTPLDPRVKNAILGELECDHGNPSSIHAFGKSAKSRLINSRRKIAEYLQVKMHEVIFTSGGTEGINMVMRGVFGCSTKGHLITSDLEHACSYTTAQYLESTGVDVTYLQSDLTGAVTPEAVAAAIQPGTRLISLMAVNNETGVKTDIDAIAKIAENANIPFLVDGVALLGKESFSIPDGVSAICFSGHKLHAPQGIGFSFIRGNFKFAPLVSGGAQEYQRRGGTENFFGAIAIGEAVSFLADELPAASKRMEMLRDRLERGLIDKLPDVIINGSGPRICNTSNMSFLGVEGESLLAYLDMEGIAVSHGSACAAGALEPSRILLNMGISRECAASSIRFSLSRFTTLEEIDYTIDVVASIVSKLRSMISKV